MPFRRRPLEIRTLPQEMSISTNAAGVQASCMSEPRCQSYRDLLVWQKALALAVSIHRATVSFPRSERFGLVSQLRRAAVSVPSNIAEGSARRTTRDFAAFLHVARGSLAELDTQLLLAMNVGYLDESQHTGLAQQVDEVGRIINALPSGLRRRAAASY
jgi:four helix bundle protein